MDQKRVSAAARVKTLLAEGASVVDLFRELEGAFMFALLDAIPIGLVTARNILIEMRRSPERYAHLHLRELEHLARVWAFERKYGFLDSHLTHAILERIRGIEFWADRGVSYRYITDDPDRWRGTGRTSGPLDAIRAQVHAAMLDPEWDGELRIVSDEPTRFVIDFPRIR